DAVDCFSPRYGCVEAVDEQQHKGKRNDHPHQKRERGAQQPSNADFRTCLCFECWGRDDRAAHCGHTEAPVVSITRSTWAPTGNCCRRELKTNSERPDIVLTLYSTR